MIEQSQATVGHDARSAPSPALSEHRQTLETQFNKLLKEARSDAAGGRKLADAVLNELRRSLEILRAAEDDFEKQSSQLAQAHEDCDRERERYHDLFQFCPDPYFVTTDEGTICEANHAAAKLIDRSIEDLLKLTFFDLLHEEERTGFMQRLADLQRLGRIDDWKVNLCPDASTVIPVSISVMASDRDDRRNELRWLVRDMTIVERDRTEMQQMRDEVHRSERLTAIGTLAAGLGHDVKNLLLPMRSRLKSLANADLPERARDDLDGLQHAVSYLQQLSSNLQLMSERPDPTQAIQGTTEIEAWWEHVAPLMRTATRSKVKVAAQFHSDLPVLNIAPHLLTQAVMNLVTNASEIMPGGGRITIWAEQSGPFVKLGVSDEGPGMSPEVLRRALDPFYTTKPRGHGLSTGMGLSLVRSIAKSVAGSVRIDSTPGRGTTVVLRLPIASDASQCSMISAGTLPTAAISISDSHLASTMCTLLNLSRLPSWRCDPHDPGDCKVWVVEPQRIAIAMAREFLRHDERRRLVLYGDKSKPWQDLDAVWIEPTADLSTIRDVLTQIAFDVLQEH